MGQIYSRKKDNYDKDERTMNASEFVERMVTLNRKPKLKKENLIESTL